MNEMSPQKLTAKDFATDQEGATWVPNGNPFDELLHIQTGKKTSSSFPLQKSQSLKQFHGLRNGPLVR